MMPFKAKSAKTGEWETSPCSKGILENGVCQYDFLPDTLCLYTSISDIDGKDVYTNDIIEVTTDFGKSIGIIRFGKYQNAFAFANGGHIGFYIEWVIGEKKDILLKDLGYWQQKLRVIGNAIDDDINKVNQPGY